MDISPERELNSSVVIGSQTPIMYTPNPYGGSGGQSVLTVGMSPGIGFNAAFTPNRDLSFTPNRF